MHDNNALEKMQTLNVNRHTNPQLILNVDRDRRGAFI